MKVIKYGNKVLKKDGFIWCYEEPFTPVPFDNNVVFTPCNEEYVRFRFTASKSGYTNEDVWKNINQFSPLWLYKDGSRTEPTNNVKVVKYSDDSGYYSTYTPTGGDGVYHLDLKVSNTKGEVAPKNGTTSCGDLIIGNIIDSNVNITGTWSESNDKLTWTISRIGGYTEMVEYSELAKQIADYTVTISGAASKTDTSTTLEYSTSTLESGDYTAVIQANSSKKSGAKSAESNTITFTKSSTPVVGPVIRKLNRSLSFMIYDISSSSDFIFYADKDYSSVYYWSSYETNEKPTGSFSWGSTTYTLVKQGKLTGMTVTKISDEKYKYVVPKDNANCIAFSIPANAGEWSQAQTGTLYMIDAEKSPTYITENKLLYTVGDGQLGNWNNAVYTGKLVEGAGWMTPTENGTPYYEV